MARYTVLCETNNIDTNWSTFLTLLRDLEHRFIPTKTINMNGRRRNTFPIAKKTRDLRDRPFNLKGAGGYGFLFRSEFFFRTTQALEYLFFMFQNLTLGYMTKTLNQIFFFSTKIRIFFFSNTGNQNIFLEKNHNPPFKLNGRSLIKRKNTLSKKVASSSDHPIRQEYNRVRNKVKGAVNKMKKKFEKDLYENAKKNPKAIRSYIKSKSKTREGIGDLHIVPEDTNSEKTQDNKKKANILSDYFSSVFTNEPLGELPQMIPVEIQYELKDLIINKDMVLKLLQNLKTDKSPGPDSLHPRLLFEIKESIAEPLSIIFNQSLALKTARKEWENAQISAIFKKGNKSQAKNYRSVS
jgi:hypothetical protein